MSRSKWKAAFFKSDIKKVSNNLKNKQIIMSRSSKILPKFIGLSYAVHNGQSYDEVIVSKDMLGHKFGEFSQTKKSSSFKKKKKKKW